MADDKKSRSTAFVMRSGPALPAGRRSNTATAPASKTPSKSLQYDLYYIKNMSLGLDIMIMFQTIKIVLLGRGAQ